MQQEASLGEESLTSLSSDPEEMANKHFVEDTSEACDELSKEQDPQSSSSNAEEVKIVRKRTVNPSALSKRPKKNTHRHKLSHEEEHSKSSVSDSDEGANLQVHGHKRNQNASTLTQTPRRKACSATGRRQTPPRSAEKKTKKRTRRLPKLNLHIDNENESVDCAPRDVNHTTYVDKNGLWCVRCKKYVSHDSFSNEQRRMDDTIRRCLRHWGMGRTGDPAKVDHGIACTQENQEEFEHKYEQKIRKRDNIDAGRRNITFPIGQYDGKIFGDVYLTDASYVEWVLGVKRP
mmetsp:Transcript_4398/g.9688  ORF Transcript_4398/g.9688 Transcript_4398/m.9688 type:complete len:290 (-) Transcript_4398:1988-2857(-)